MCCDKVATTQYFFQKILCCSKKNKVADTCHHSFIVKEDGLILLHLEKGELNQPISLSAEDSNDLL